MSDAAKSFLISRAQTWAETARAHWPILLILCGAAFLLFASLGDDYLWEDEGDTAVLADNILEYGVPKAWDGVTLTNPDKGARLNKDLVMVSSPWLQYYTAAASFLVFGESAFTARFPFALAGWLTILALYVLVLRLTADRRAAISASLLLALSIQFLLYSRQCRNYPLYMLLVCCLLLMFFRLANWRAGLGFALLSGLLFHCNPAGLAPLGALGLLTLIYPPCRAYRRWFWLSLPLTLALVGPWFFFASSGYEENTVLTCDWRRWCARLAQFLVECWSLTPLAGALVLLAFVWIRRYQRRRKEMHPVLQSRKRTVQRTGKGALLRLLSSEERLFLVVTGVILGSYAALLAITQRAEGLWTSGLRYAVPIIPLVMGLTGILISKASGTSKTGWVALVLTFALTNFGNIRPWFVFGEKRGISSGTFIVGLHPPTDWQTKLFKTGLISFWEELHHENRGTIAQASTFLKAHASTNDVLISNYCWEALYFHTSLAQGLKMKPTFPRYDAAREHGLPEYVFSDTGVRWIVWRQVWNGYNTYNWDELYRSLTTQGATITPVAAIDETVWENRSNLHFHRFPRSHYRFQPLASEKHPPAYIFRVDWPEAKVNHG